MPAPRPPSRYLLPANADSAEVRAFASQVAREFSLPPQLGEILHHRGVTTLDQVQQFLYPQLAMLPSPETMKGMGPAVACILAACQTGKPIFIHGDYDVDGISATALLLTFFGEIGIEATCYIPNRLEEGYGLSRGSIDRLLALTDPGQLDQIRGGVLITVDCGITAIAEVAYAQGLGLRVVITDHHEPKEELPGAEAILDPKQPGCGFPFAQLAGVGVAFFLIIALRRALVEGGLIATTAVPNLKKYLDLVALGTVADVVPLIGVNRILVRAGLEVLSAKNRFGVFSLCELCGIADHQVLAEDIAFKLAPRINAAGRFGVPLTGVELLLADSLEQSRQLAIELEQLNQERKQLEQAILPLLAGQCGPQIEAGADGLVVYQPGCHPGISGILASKIGESHRRPTIIFTDELQQGAGEARLKGSGRSIPGVNLFQLLDQCSPWIEQYGGHAMAVGLSIKKSQLEPFVQAFHRQARMQRPTPPPAGQVAIDFHLRDTSQLDQGLVQSLQLLQPFGEGNPEPVFLLTGELLLQPREIKGHLAFNLRGDRQLFPGIGFHLAEAGRNFHQPVDLVFQLKRSWYKGVGRDQIQALHLIPV